MSVPSVTQVFNTPATEWLVQHNLNKFVTSDVFIYDVLDRPVKVLPLEALYIDDNQFKVVFSTPQRGLVKVM